MLNSHINIKRYLKLSMVLNILLLLCLSAIAIYEAIKYNDNDIKNNYYRIDNRKLIEIKDDKISFYYCIEEINFNEFDSLKMLVK